MNADTTCNFHQWWPMKKIFRRCPVKSTTLYNRYNMPLKNSTQPSIQFKNTPYNTAKPLTPYSTLSSVPQTAHTLQFSGEKPSSPGKAAAQDDARNAHVLKVKYCKIIIHSEGEPQTTYIHVKVLRSWRPHKSWRPLNDTFAP